MELFSLQPWDFVTVADIVERAGMTPALGWVQYEKQIRATAVTANDRPPI